MRSAVLFVLLGLAILCGTGIARAADNLSGRTILTYSSYGTQVHYFDAAGKTFLWYPTNSKVLPGDWKLDAEQVCFRYGKDTYNVATRGQGGRWECGAMASFQSEVIDRKSGDVFGLAAHGKSRTVPYMLDRDRYTIAAIKANIAGLEAAGERMAREDAVPVKEKCARILANADKSRTGKIEAALLYFHGMQMGESCVATDYVKAVTMLREAGEDRTAASLIKSLEDKAAAGNPKAASALRKLGHE